MAQHNTVRRCCGWRNRIKIRKSPEMYHFGYQFWCFVIEIEQEKRCSSFASKQCSLCLQCDFMSDFQTLENLFRINSHLTTLTENSAYFLSKFLKEHPCVFLSLKKWVFFSEFQFSHTVFSCTYYIMSKFHLKNTIHAWFVPEACGQTVLPEK